MSLSHSSNARASLLVLLAATAGVARAAEPLRCVVVADDFVPRAARVERLDDRALVYVEEGANQPVTLPIERLVRLERFPSVAPDRSADRGAAAAGGFLFLLRNGERLAGTPAALTGDDLTVANGDAAAIPMQSIVAVVATRDASRGEIDRLAMTAGAVPRDQDELLLKNGDLVAGVVSASDERSVTVQAADGSATTAEWANVRTLRLASVAGTAAATPAAAAPMRLTLRDGRVVDGVATVGPEGVAFRGARGARLAALAPGAIVAIEHRAGRARLLADLTPTQRTHVGYFPGANADAPAAAPPLVRDGQPVRSAIHMRPRGAITWPLDGSMRTFVARYAIPEGRPLADATVRVKIDGAVAHEQAHVRAGPPSEALKLPLGAARTITLEVDYGDNYDVQDDVYWIDAALLPE